MMTEEFKHEEQPLQITKAGRGKILLFVEEDVAAALKSQFGTIPVRIGGAEHKIKDIQSTWEVVILPVLYGEDVRWTYDTVFSDSDWEYEVACTAIAWECYNDYREAIQQVLGYAKAMGWHAVVLHATQMLDILPHDEVPPCDDSFFNPQSNE